MTDAMPQEGQRFFAFEKSSSLAAICGAPFTAVKLRSATEHKSGKVTTVIDAVDTNGADRRFYAKIWRFVPLRRA